MPDPESPNVTPPWRRFRHLLTIVAIVAALAAAGALFWLHAEGVVLGWVMIVAVVAGIMLSLLLGGTLMGLVYASARSGADDDIGTTTRTPRV